MLYFKCFTSFARTRFTIVICKCPIPNTGNIKQVSFLIWNIKRKSESFSLDLLTGYFCVFFRNGGAYVRIFQWHDHRVLHNLDSVACRSIRCHLLPYSSDKEALVKVRGYDKFFQNFDNIEYHLHSFFSAIITSAIEIYLIKEKKLGKCFRKTHRMISGQHLIKKN